MSEWWEQDERRPPGPDESHPLVDFYDAFRHIRMAVARAFGKSFRGLGIAFSSLDESVRHIGPTVDINPSLRKKRAPHPAAGDCHKMYPTSDHYSPAVFEVRPSTLDRRPQRRYHR